MSSKSTIILGGGLAGLVCALQLSGQGVQVTLIERKKYPFHKVCGEYVSNEVLPYLKGLQVDLEALGPARLTHLFLTSPKGRSLQLPLDLGGTGISRYLLDHHLYLQARQQGVIFRELATATDVNFHHQQFTVTLSTGEQLHAPVVIGAYGKRSNLDRRLNRPFFEERSPFMAVKYHIRTQHPKHLIALHNFRDGYAGLSAIEGDHYCFCYLTTRQNLKHHGTIAALETHELSKNPFLKEVFTNSDFLYPQPLVINEISFAPKACLEKQVLMAGDAAGLITPLCGNGMAMAIHAGKMLSEQVILFLKGTQTRQQMEASYARQWNHSFKARLQMGRMVQRLFGHPVLSELAIATLRQTPALARAIMRQTHGQPFS